MKAVCYMGVEKMSVETVPDPTILNPRDAIVKISSTCICGSDLHLYDGFVPTMEQGDIMGHEFMGEVVEVGAGLKPDKLKVGDRVVVPFTIACGNCFFCKKQLWSLCNNSNPNYWMAEEMMGFSPSGLFAPKDEPDWQPKAYANFAGHVEGAEVVTNPISNRPFHHLVVRTGAGVFDVVADPAIPSGTPEVGGVVHGEFWLSGRIITKDSK